LDAFQAAKNWWLLVDGFDDSGSAADMVRLIREANHLAEQREWRLVISSRLNLLEYVVERTFSDDLARFLNPAWIVAVDGLLDEGYNRRRKALEKEFSDIAKNGFNALDKAASDGGQNLVNSIKRMPLVVNGISKLYSELQAHSSQKPVCVIDNWARVQQFEAHCIGELCGNDERKALIERTWRKMVTILDQTKEEIIVLQGLDEKMSEVVSGRSRSRAAASVNQNAAGRDSILYALLGTGVLDPIYRDHFKIIKNPSVFEGCSNADDVHGP
jgi:hypothetical protein